MNSILEQMEWLVLAGVSQCVQTTDELPKLMQYACNWLCLGDTRPAIERSGFTFTW